MALSHHNEGQFLNWNSPSKLNPLSCPQISHNYALFFSLHTKIQMNRIKQPQTKHNDTTWIFSKPFFSSTHHLSRMGVLFCCWVVCGWLFRWDKWGHWTLSVCEVDGGGYASCNTFAPSARDHNQAKKEWYRFFHAKLATKL